MGNLGVGDRDPRQMRDTANGRGVHGHYIWPQAGVSARRIAEVAFAPQPREPPSRHSGLPEGRNSGSKAGLLRLPRHHGIATAKPPDETVFGSRRSRPETVGGCTPGALTT